MLVTLFQIVFWVIMVFIAIGLPIEFFIYLYERRYSDIEPITFKTFVSLYHTNKYRWSWRFENDSHLCYYTPKGYYDVGFKHFIDYWRFHIWRHALKRKETKSRRLKETAEILEQWQNDVNRHKTKSEKEIAAAADLLLKQAADLTGLNEDTLKLINKVKEKVQ